MARSTSPADPEHAPAWRWQDGDLLLDVQVQPRARRDECSGRHGDTFRIRLAAPPVDGQANAALIAFLAATFGVAKRRVLLVSGETGRRKRLRILKPVCLPEWLTMAADHT